jgi:hypothetical protein
VGWSLLGAVGAGRRGPAPASISRPRRTPTRAFARAARVPDSPVRWRMRYGPWFDNQGAQIELHGLSARLTLERVVPAEAGARLERVLDHRLA